MPVPQSVTVNQGGLRLNKSFSISVKGSPDERLYSGATRFLRRLSGRTGLFFPQAFITNKDNSDTTVFQINCRRKGQVKLGEDESYSLEVTGSRATLSAETDLGAMKGLETFLQLLEADADGYYIPAVTINDSPRFRWRGLMMDVSRHFMPLEVVYRNLDAMAAVKLNVFHWHLSDDQGFRVESKSLPKLHQLASDGMYYTQDEVRKVIAYANERGIRVVPEFDIPGHSTSWLAAFPELASAPGPYTIERNWGVLDPVFDPTNEATYKFFDRFLAEMTKLFNDEYFHIGGDENNGKQWNANKKIEEFKKKHNMPDNHALQAYFNNRILKMLTKYNKKMVGWDEILHPDMPKNIVIHSWRGPKGLAEAAQKGYQAILSNGYYIDLIQPASFHYLNDPLPKDNTLTEEQRKLVLGGEATMWAEMVTAENVDSRIWPRMGVIAERLWSDVSVTDLDDMYRRMELLSLQLEELGITHIKNPEMMMRRMIKGRDIEPLKTFISAIEPVKIYNRHRQGVKYTSYSPYTRVVDAAIPDAPAARNFNRMADRFIASPNDEAAAGGMTAMLAAWKENHSRLKPLIDRAPVLKEIETMSEDLSLLSSAAIQAVEMIKKGQKSDAQWAENARQLLERSKKPRGQAEIMIIEGADKLIRQVVP